MRKVSSSEQALEKKQRNAKILSVFMLFVLVLGTIGYAFVSKIGSPNTEIQNPNVWQITRDDKTFYLSNSKESVESIPVTISKTIGDFTNQEVYLVSKNSAVAFEITSAISQVATFIRPACYDSCDANLPEKDCTTNLIVWRDSLEKKVYQEDNCIFIEGTLESADAFLYSILEA